MKLKGAYISAGKESTCNAGDPRWIPGLRRSPGEGIGYHSSILGLPLWLSWQRILLQCESPGFDPWVGKISWRKERLPPTPVFWPGEFHGLYSLWSGKESDTTEWLSLSAPWKKSYDKPRQCIKKQTHHLPIKIHIIKAMSFLFFGSHVQMWELGHKEGWAPRNWWFWAVVLEKTLESLLASKEIKPVNPKGNQSWIFIERTDAEATIFGQLMWRANSLEKTLVLGKIEGRRRRGNRGWDVGWHHQLSGETWLWTNSEIMKEGTACVL